MKYYLALLKTSDKTVTLQARKNKDSLSPQIWVYFGEFINTKNKLKANKSSLLTEINKKYNKQFKHLVID